MSKIDNQAVTEEVGYAIHDILKKHFHGKVVPVGDVINITISALGPVLADVISFVNDEKEERFIKKIIYDTYGKHLCECIDKYMMK